MNTAAMREAIADYDRAKKTLEWFASYDADEKTVQIKLHVDLRASSTPGSGPTLETLRDLAGEPLATQLRQIALVWAKGVVDNFPARMAELLAET